MPRPEAPFPVIGKLGKQPLEAVLELCRPGEQPRFVVAEGIYGALAAFEDRCAIIKKGLDERRRALLATYQYGELSGIRFVPKTFTGTLELDPGARRVRRVGAGARGDVQKRDDALQLSKELYEKAHDHLSWLRGQITPPGARRIPTSSSWTS